MPAYQFKGRPEIGCTKASFGGRLTAAASARNAWLAITAESVSTIVCNNPPINSPIIICGEPATSMRRPSSTMSPTLTATQGMSARKKIANNREA